MSVAAPEIGNVAGELALDQLDAQHWPNPRGDVDTASPAFAELKASIEQQGILEPIVIGPPLLELDGRHAIVAGWRRYTAAAALGLPTVPVHQRIDITDARAALRAALAENLAREGMTPLAEASAIAKLVELGDTQAAAAAAVGVSERTARERLRLLELPKPVRDGIDTGKIPTTCTRQLQLVADAAPAAATAIAKKIAKGDVRAVDLLEPAGLDRVLDGLTAKAGVAKLGNYVYLKTLGLAPEIYKALKARNKESQSYSYDAGETIDFSPAAVGKKLLDQAREAGKVITVPARYGGDAVYLAGAEWIERAATAAVERVERQAAARKREQAKAAAENTAKTAGRDPETIRHAEHTARGRAIDDRARPYAAAMNAEIGRRLRGMGACAIQGPVARVMLELTLTLGADDPVGWAYTGANLVDPDSRWAKIDPGGADGYDEWVTEIRTAKTPDAAAAQIVGALVGCVCADPRGREDNSRWYNGDVVRELAQLVREAAIKLKLLPERAIAYAQAVANLEAEQDRYHRQRDRRRILLELSTAARNGLDVDELAKRGEEWGRDCGDLPEIAMQLTRGRFDPALQDLLDDGDAAAVEKTDDKTAIVRTTITITPAGRKRLKALPDLPPLIADIDADTPLPEGEAT